VPRVQYLVHQQPNAGIDEGKLTSKPGFTP
jgi:hypothetical protein